jgi:hypothetical protein
MIFVAHGAVPIGERRALVVARFEPILDLGVHFRFSGRVVGVGVRRERVSWIGALLVRDLILRRILSNLLIVPRVVFHFALLD